MRNRKHPQPPNTGLLVIVTAVIVVLHLLALAEKAHAADTIADRDAYLAAQLELFGVAEIVPVEWTTTRALTPRAILATGNRVYGETYCERFANVSGNYVVCSVRLAWPGKRDSGGYRDTIRHELCHVYVAAAGVAMTQPGDRDAVRDLDTSHAAPLFIKCALYHNVSLDGSDR